MFARNRLRARIVLIFAHDMQIQEAHALCKQGCRLISYTADIRLVTIATCYNCPRSPLTMKRTYFSAIILDRGLQCFFFKDCFVISLPYSIQFDTTLKVMYRHEIICTGNTV